MTRTMRKAYTEVNEILKYIPNEYIEKIPLKFRRMFSDCILPDYKVNIDPNKSINEQKLVYETLVILAILKYNYWCESEEERQKIRVKLKENDEKTKQMYDISILMSKSNKANLIKEDTKDIETLNVSKASKENILPVKVEKASWFAKIISKIKSIFKR